MSEFPGDRMQVDGMTKSARKVHHVSPEAYQKISARRLVDPGRENERREGRDKRARTLHGNGTAEPHERTGDERRTARGWLVLACVLASLLARRVGRFVVISQRAAGLA
ncbi:hypothetical protein CSOJ01_10874 [Colletotrichum sojae]|uniref:Uncharacterized protein n=1 Tax=Colletotrichum sojae TaxID=2175907 RepID=A0A8H6IYY7_9PEZI|nr:hypothetical protein CSOJ01_10874 [Colletotrichum sojae]